jgi:glycosyltransferase involved in cell wall biosynthesis
MNILYLCDEYPPGKHGGIGTYVRLIARQMVKLGHNVVVAGLYGPGYGGANEFNDEGVKVYRFRRGLDFGFLGEETSLASRIGIRLLKDSGLMERDLKKSLKAYKNKLEQLITAYKIDIVEMPDYNDYVRFCSSYIPFPQLSVPVVIKMHGSITYFTKEVGGVVAEQVVKMEQTILNQAAAVSSASRYTADKSAQYLFYSKKIEVLYNGIKTDLPARSTPKVPRQVIFTGTLTIKKGIYQLAKAWNIVNKSIPDARLLVLGKGSQQKVMAHLTDGAKASVSLKGHVSADQLYDHLSASAISIFPSYAEAFALAPLEAMACGAAVINSNRTSGPELINDKVNGLLIDPDDIDQIATAILYLLNNPDECARLAKAGNEKVKEQFEIGKVAVKTLQFYEKVLKGVS